MRSLFNIVGNFYHAVLCQAAENCAAAVTAGRLKASERAGVAEPGAGCGQGTWMGTAQ